MGDWARRVGCWNFNRIVPCHFDAPIKAGPREWNAAFGFLPSSRPDESTAVDGAGEEGFGRGAGRSAGVGRYYPDEDMVLLRGVEDFLQGSGVIFTDTTRPKRNLGIISGAVPSSSTAPPAIIKRK